MFDCGDQISFIWCWAIVAKSAAVNATPCVIAVCGVYRQLGVVVIEPSLANSPAAFASLPSPTCARNAGVLPLAKFAHTPSGFDGGNSALVCTESADSP